jgi:hypothetical protein
MTSHGNGLSRAIEPSEKQAQSLQDQKVSAAFSLQQILARRPKVTGRRGRPSAVAEMDEGKDRATGLNNAGNARIYTSQTEPYRELLCGMVQQAYEDAKNDRSYKRANTANIRDTNTASAIYFFKSRCYTEICDALGIDGERIKRKALL